MSEVNNILINALALFKEKGPKHTTMEDIANRTGISKKTLYKCFKDKAALVGAAYSDVINNTENKLRNLLAEPQDAVQELLNMSKQILCFFRFFTPVVQESLMHTNAEVYEELQLFKNQFLPTVVSYNIERGISSGLYKKEIESNIIAHLFLTQLAAYDKALWPLQHEYAGKDIQQHLLAHLLYGVTTAAGSSIADHQLITLK